MAQLIGARPAPESPAIRVIGRDGKLPLAVALFLVGMVIPLLFNIGSLRLSPYRLVLLIFFFPALFRLLSGRAGPIILSDIIMFMICIWTTLALVVVHGLTPMIETIGIFFVEVLGAYLLGRCYIRTPEAFFATARLLFWITVVILPFAVIEAATNHHLLLDFFGKIGRTYPESWVIPRWGLDRVQGPFPHPIHFGVFFGALVGITYYVFSYGRSFFRKLFYTFIVSMTAAFALSSGPLTAMVAQLYFITWDVILNKVKSRWYILSGLAILAYVVVDSLSNRNPFQVFISYFAFNEGTAYNRINIWIHGTRSIWNNPIWGVGITSNWVRPEWMSPSVDMFWIVPGMQNGVLAWFLYFALFFSVMISVILCKNFDARLQSYRLGYLATMFGLFMAGWTVHYWDATIAMFMFLLSSGIWMLDYDASADQTDKDQTEAPRPTRAYSRFPITSDSQMKIPAPSPVSGRRASLARPKDRPR